MAKPLALAFDVPETTGGDEDSLEPSPYEESEVHDSFHQLIQEQSLRVAEEGLELLSLGPEVTRPSLDLKAPLSLARPLSASWPACPVVPLVAAGGPSFPSTTTAR